MKIQFLCKINKIYTAFPLLGKNNPKDMKSLSDPPAKAHLPAPSGKGMVLLQQERFFEFFSCHQVLQNNFPKSFGWLQPRINARIQFLLQSIIF